MWVSIRLLVFLFHPLKGEFKRNCFYFSLISNKIRHIKFARRKAPKSPIQFQFKHIIPLYEEHTHINFQKEVYRKFFASRIKQKPCFFLKNKAFCNSDSICRSSFIPAAIELHTVQALHPTGYNRSLYRYYTSHKRPYQNIPYR